MIKRMLKMAKPWWGELIVTVISLLAASLLSLVTPEAIRKLTALLGTPGDATTALILKYCGILVGAYLLRALCRFLSMWQEIECHPALCIYKKL